MKISKVAKILGKSTKTLRRWEAKGLFVPERTAKNFRVYDIEIVDKIKTYIENKSKAVKVQCLYCLLPVKMPKVAGIEYVTWPVVHTACRKPKNDKKQS